MASIKRYLSGRIDRYGKSEILLRLSIDGNNKQRLKSGIFITATRFRDGMIIKPRANQREIQELERIEVELYGLERMLISLCREHTVDELTKDFFLEAIERFRHPERSGGEVNFFEAFNEFLDVSDLSAQRIKQYRVLYKTLARFEAFRRIKLPRFSVSLECWDEQLLGAFVEFLKTEHEIYDRYPQLYDAIEGKTGTLRRLKRPVMRGSNTISSELKLLRAFINWAIRRGYADHNPFGRFTIPGERYGTPFYLTVEERNSLASLDLSHRPGLGVQRDIFVFQCLTGCRVSDLYSLLGNSVIRGAIEYVPRKTKGERPEVVRVPLNDQAADLVARYGARGTDPLFPFISTQRYNDAIKEMIRLAGIDRMVTVLDSVTGCEVKHPIYEVASSHMARRTFIGNLYKKVKDPNLVGALSGHKEGSRAFARYREIDDDIKRELVDLL